MMVTWVRGLFKDIHGRELDWDHCLDATFEGEIDAAGIWTGEPDRDAHLRSADFLDAENHPKIAFTGRFTERTAETACAGSASRRPPGSTAMTTASPGRTAPGRGVVVSNEIELFLDIEAILLEDLEPTGAIDHYRERGTVY